MSKQLAISAAFSTFAMAAFALFASPVSSLGGSAGAPNGFEAPARAELPAAPALSLLAD